MKPPRPWEDLYPPELRSYRLDEGALPDSVDQLARAAAQAFEHRDAFTIVLPGGQLTSLTFRQVDELASAFASFLANHLRLPEGAVLAVQLPNSLHYPIAVFGAWRAGLIVTNINPLYTERELRQQLADSGAKAIVAFDMALPRVETVASELECAVLVANLRDIFSDPSATAAPTMPAAARMAFSDALDIGRALPPTARTPSSIALYQYTGGTTGRSKGAVITHRNLLSALVLVRDFLGASGHAPRSDETVLTVLPLYHVFAFVMNFLLFFEVGARNVLIPNPRPLASLRPAFEQFQIDWTSGVDTLYAGLLSEEWFTVKPPKLKWAMSGGAALRSSTAEAWQRLVCPIIEGYGMTETCCIVATSPPTRAPRLGTVGIPLPGTDVRIVDEAGNTVPVGQAGELLVRGPQVIERYLNQPEETASAIVHGWLHTGDIAQFDADGYLRIVDRKKDMILVSGFNVYPNEVEGVISSHPDVVDVAVIGMPDSTTGEAVCAFITPRRQDLSAAEIIHFCARLLTGYKVPKQVFFREQLPKSPVGKILRAQLRNPG